jgi:hypothetical protein
VKRSFHRASYMVNPRPWRVSFRPKAMRRWGSSHL